MRVPSTSKTTSFTTFATAPSRPARRSGGGAGAPLVTEAAPDEEAAAGASEKVAAVRFAIAGGVGGAPPPLNRPCRRGGGGRGRRSGRRTFRRWALAGIALTGNTLAAGSLGRRAIGGAAFGRCRLGRHRRTAEQGGERDGHQRGQPHAYLTSMRPRRRHRRARQHRLPQTPVPTDTIISPRTRPRGIGDVSLPVYRARCRAPLRPMAWRRRSVPSSKAGRVPQASGASTIGS